MQTEVKNWRYICDRCGAKEIVRDEPFNSNRPEGWGSYLEPARGSNFNKLLDLCPACHQKQQEDSARKFRTQNLARKG